MSDDDFDMSLGDMPTMNGAEKAASLAHIDRYKLVNKLGRGAFGAVFLAKDEIADTEVAIKTLPPEINHSPEEMDAVRDNFRFVSRLAHPNIAQFKYLHQVEKLKDPGTGIHISVGDYLVVMEYVAGPTLRNWLRQFPGKKAPLDKALDLCRQVAQALDYAHSQSIIHRDIKPGNIMITQEGQAKVLDFGLASELRSSMSRVSTDTGSTSGTRPYMPPEQLLGRKQDQTSDQYALAAMLYEMVSGAVPFQSVFETNDMQLILGVIPNNPVEALDELDKKQNAVLLKALAKDKADRFATCTEFIEALSSGQAAKSKGSSASAKSSSESTKSGGLIVAGVVGLAVLAGGAYFVMSGKDTPAPVVEIKKDTPVVAELVKQEPKKVETEVKKVVAQVKTEQVKQSSVDRLNLLKARAAAESKQKALAKINPVLAKEKESLGLVYKTAELLFSDKDYEQAYSRYQEFLSSLAKLEKLEQEMQSALDARKSFSVALAKANRDKWKDFSSKEYQELEKKNQATGQQFNERKFVAAVQGYTEMQKTLIVLEELTLSREAHAAYLHVYAGKESLLKDFAKEDFDALSTRVADAENLQKQNKFAESSQKWKINKAYLATAIKRADLAKSESERAAKLAKAESEKKAEFKSRVAEFTAELKKAQDDMTNQNWTSLRERLKNLPDYDLTSPDYKIFIKSAQNELNSKANISFISSEGKKSLSGVKVLLDGKAISFTKGLALERGRPYRLSFSKLGYTTKAIDFKPDFAGEKSFSFELEYNLLGNDIYLEEWALTLKRMDKNGEVFWLGIYEVSQSQYQKVMAKNPSHFKGTTLPVDSVSWTEANSFCQKLTSLARAKSVLPEGYVFRLPKESEWLLATGASTYAYGSYLNTAQANIQNTKTHSVGSHKVSDSGFYDLHGNVWEWCLDSKKENGKALAVRKGGGYASKSENCSTAFDAWAPQYLALKNTGFRLVLVKGN